MKNNPVRYKDPSGHKEVDTVEALEYVGGLFWEGFKEGTSLLHSPIKTIGEMKKQYEDKVKSYKANPKKAIINESKKTFMEAVEGIIIPTSLRPQHDNAKRIVESLKSDNPAETYIKKLGQDGGELVTEAAIMAATSGLMKGVPKVRSPKIPVVAKEGELAAVEGAKGVVENLSPRSLNPTHGLTMSKNKFNKFMNDIKTNGINEPIKYVEHNGNKFVVDGNHRLKAAKRLDLKDVPSQKVNLPYQGYKTVNDLFGDY